MNKIYRDYLNKGEKAGARYAMKMSPRSPLGQAGMRLGVRSGSSLDFKEHREYQPGDDLRSIDWGAYARSDKLIIKQYQEEVSPHLDIVIDCSRSMVLENSSKLEATLGIAAVFAMAAMNSGYTHCAWSSGEHFKPLAQGNGRPSHWDDIVFGYRGYFSDSLKKILPPWRCPGIRLLISDLLWPGDPGEILTRFSAGATAIIVVQVLAKEDVEPSLHGNIRLVDYETNEIQNIFIDERALKLYGESLARHRQAWSTACRRFGAVLAGIVAEDVIQDWRLHELMSMEILTTTSS